MKNLICLLVLFILGMALNTSALTSFVTKTGNGFERIVVSIDERLALPSASSSSSNSGTLSSPSSSTGLREASQQECHKILEQLKNLITRTSEYLFEATNGQTYFRQVSILLPSNWANSNCTGGGSGGDSYSSTSSTYQQFNQETVSTATYQTPSSADILVTTDHPVYIDKPFALQYGPCGVPGKRISIPISFITEEGSDANPDSLRARLLVREWVKFRYGVFDENGFAHDDKYPGEFVGPNGKVVPTACHLNRSSCSDPELCDNVHVHHSNHHHHNHHHPHGKSDGLGSLSTSDTSMMSLPLLNSVNEFCDERTHIRTTPTKHNFLCDGKSIWGVMKQHEDFRNMIEDWKKEQEQPSSNGSSMESSTASGSTLRSIVSAPPPVFSYVTAKSHRLLFLLDRSSSMNHNNRWSNLRRSLYRMFNHLPSGVELGVISYTNTSSVSLPLTVTTTHNRDPLHGRIPVRPLTAETDESCVSCALKAAVKLIKSSDENVGPATLILVNGSPNKVHSREWDRVMKIVENTPLRVIVITYEEDSLSDGTRQLMDLGRFGAVYKVPDQGSSGNYNLDQNEFLSNVFIQIISENLGTPLNKVYDSVHWPDADWQARGKFTVEESLGRNTRITVTTEESGDVDGLQLVSPSGAEFDLPLTAEGVMFQVIPGAAEAGTWTYNIKFYHHQSPRPALVDVTTESRKTESVAVKFWNQVVKQPTRQEDSGVSSQVANSGSATELPYVVDADGDADVVLLYAQVLQGEIPVLNANVTATITLPGPLRHGGSNVVSVRLLDTGSGDPDITWGDGIYSAYFTQLGPNAGLFTVSLHIDDNNGQAVIPVHTNITRKSYDKPACCGSTVPHIATVPTGSFVRKIAGNSFYIDSGVPLGEDPYPPGRVTDLRVERVVDSASEIKLTWTAPGGDYDKGRAARYEIRCFISRDALTNENFSKQGILVNTAITPEPEDNGVRQSCTVAVPWANDYFYYGIVAIDSSHNRGKVSNLVSVLIKETPASTARISNAWEDDALVSNLTSSRSNSKGQGVFQAGASWFRGLSELELYLVLGGGAVFLILVSVFILLLACVKRRGTKTNEAPPSYHNIYNQNASKTGSGSPNSSKDGIGCCWENESSNHAETKQNPSAQSNNQKSSMNGNYITSSVSSYIPASALCSPVPVQNGSVYRDMYAGSASTQHTHTTHDSSSVDSKPSDGGSHDTVQITDSIVNGPTPFYVQNVQQTPVSRMSMNVPFDPMSMGSMMQHSLHLTSSGLSGMMHNQPNHNNLSRDSNSSAYLTSSKPEYNASDDDEGGFRSQRRDNLHHKTVPMPSASDYADSPTVMNGSTYGGSVISLPNSNKKRTRHISFV